MMSNSNVELFEPLKVTIVDNDKIIFKLHKLGFITCLCGEVVQNHMCVIMNDIKEIKVKFELCFEQVCRFCDSTIQWHYERYMQKEGDDKTYCRQCKKEVLEGVCNDCFCKECYSILAACVCCKFCIGAQCVCYENTLSVSD